MGYRTDPIGYYFISERNRTSDGSATVKPLIFVEAIGFGYPIVKMGKQCHSRLTKKKKNIAYSLWHSDNFAQTKINKFTKIFCLGKINGMPLRIQNWDRISIQ